MNGTVSNPETQRPRRGIVRAMSKSLGVVIASAALIVGGATVASATGQFGHADHCKTVSSTSQTQTRDVSGLMAASTHYGPVRRVVRHHDGHRRVIHVRSVTTYRYAGTETRTATTTTSRCSGKLTTATTAIPWTKAKIVATTMIQRVS